MKKIACYVYDQMADFEVTITLHQLRDRDKPVQADIVVASVDGFPKKGCSGLTVTADCALENLVNDPIEKYSFRSIWYQ